MDKPDHDSTPEPTMPQDAVPQWRLPPLPADEPPAEPEADEDAVAAVQPTEAVEISAAEPEAVSSPVEASVSEPAEPVVHLPWELGEQSEETLPVNDLVAEPPAVAFAPAFLAVDEDGRPVPDEVVEHLPEPIHSLPPIPLEPDLSEVSQPAVSGGDWWTIPLICIGIAIIACCLLIPQADQNGRLVWEREKLQRDLQQLQKQVDVNDTFLTAMAEDRFLAQRLAQRQMNVVGEGTAVLELDGLSELSSSPFQLVKVPPPPPLPEYHPAGGRLAELCRNPRSQLYLMGGSLLLIAAGLVLGRDEATPGQPEPATA